MTHAHEVSADGEKCAMYPRERSQSFSEMHARCGVGSCELWALDEVDGNLRIGLAPEGRGIKESCEHELERKGVAPEREIKPVCKENKEECTQQERHQHFAATPACRRSGPTSTHRLYTRWLNQHTKDQPCH